MYKIYLIKSALYKAAKGGMGAPDPTPPPVTPRPAESTISSGKPSSLGTFPANPRGAPHSVGQRAPFTSDAPTKSYSVAQRKPFVSVTR